MRQLPYYREDIDRLDPNCPSCGTPIVGSGRRYLVPIFGFVASREAPRQPGSKPPQRSWHGDTYVVSPGAEITEVVRELAGGRITARSGTRGDLVAVSDGPGGRASQSAAGAASDNRGSSGGPARTSGR